MSAAACLLVTVAGAAPSVYPVGVTTYQPDKTWNGFTVLSLLGAPGVAVIDMNGHIVKQWEGLNSSAGGPVRVLPGGEVIGAAGARQGRQESLRLVEQDFDGKELWSLNGDSEIDMPDGSKAKALRQHHDWQRADYPSGYYSPDFKPATTGANTLVLTHTDRKLPAVSDRLLQDDRLIEYGADGKVLWQWYAADHIKEFGFSAAALAAIKAGAGAGGGPGGGPGRGPGGGGPGGGGAGPGGGAGAGAGPGGNAAAAAAGTDTATATGNTAEPARAGGEARGPGRGPGPGGAGGRRGPAAPRAFDWLHTNAAAYLGPNHWYDEGDKRFAPENILISSRQASFLAIIARNGHVVWRMGPDFRETPQLQRIGQIIGQHNAHLIPKGLPGAGNLLVFDNGGASGYGFDTPIGLNGYGGLARSSSRVLEIDPVKMQTVWSYTGSGFFSTNISGAQRLPNGNTLITEGAGSRVFEVTPDKHIVWEYMSANEKGAPAAVYRAYRVPYDWIPQLPKPIETAVTPPAGFHAP